MKTVKFDCNSNNAPAYSCNKPGDKSGEYVPVEVANAMRSLIIDLHGALRAIDTKATTDQATEIRKMIGI